MVANPLSPELEGRLVDRAEAHYSDALAYHNWEHAQDVMRVAGELADRSIVPEIAARRGLLIVAAAWHDADYHLDGPADPATKEERSAALVARELTELTEADRELIMSGIIDTTVEKKPKATLFGEALHAADLGYFATSPSHFMGRLALMRKEWGSPDWETTAVRTLWFGQEVIEEAQESMPRILDELDAEVWVARIKSNLQFLETQLEAGTLVDERTS